MTDQKSNSPQPNQFYKEDFLFDEIKILDEKVRSCEDMPEDLRERLDKMLQRLNRMAKIGGNYASEFDNISKYIDVVTSIPWTFKTTDILDLQKTKEALDRNHYGMNDVKERVLEYMSTLILLQRQGENAISTSPVLLFVGLQGIGKTTLAISIAEALGRKFVRVAMGAIGSVLEIRGKSKALSDAEPGQIIKGLIQAKSKNPVILLDEVEKASGNQALLSDVMAVLLEILDPAQNIAFKDHYLDYPVNLSDCLFICTANNTGPISTAVLDRMEVIKMTSYTDNEKIVIARDYLFPKIIKSTGLTAEQLQIDPNLWPSVVRPFGFDSGIRSLGRTLEAIARKTAKEIVEGKTDRVYITAENLKFYLPK